MGEFADGAHIWERVKNRETPTIIGGECGNVIQYRKIDQFNESEKDRKNAWVFSERSYT